jgi:hypothetical protein
MRNLKRIILSVGMTALIGCGGGGGEGGSSACSDLNVKVFGGEQCDFSRSPVVAIVGFSASGTPISNCSATMVTTNDALTAAHCAAVTASPGGAGVFADGQFFRIIGGRNHPKYNGQVDSPYDVAMITIDGVLNIGPVPLLLSDPIAVGEQITIFGYGKNEDSAAIPQASDFRAGYMELSVVDRFQFAAFFDTTGSAICQGDSGGPATQTVDGVTSVVGVTSFTFRGCQEGSASGFVNVQNPEIFNFIRGYSPDVAGS